jgi:hypothetical protein
MNTRQKQSEVLLLAEVKIVIDSQKAQALYIVLLIKHFISYVRMM